MVNPVLTLRTPRSTRLRLPRGCSRESVVKICARVMTLLEKVLAASTKILFAKSHFFIVEKHPLKVSNEYLFYCQRYRALIFVFFLFFLYISISLVHNPLVNGQMVKGAKHPNLPNQEKF